MCEKSIINAPDLSSRSKEQPNNHWQPRKCQIKKGIVHKDKVTEASDEKIVTDEIQDEENMSAAIKILYQSTHGLSATQNGQGAADSAADLAVSWQHATVGIASMTQLSLDSPRIAFTSKLQVCIDLAKAKGK